MNTNWQDLKEWVAEHRKFVYGLIAVFIAAAGFLFLNNKASSKHQAQLLKLQTEKISASNSSSSSINSTAVRASSQAEKIFVDIKGAVEEPGVYKIGINERVSNVIQRAGGLKKNADIKKVNLAEKLTDQTVIYIPKKGEKRLGDYVSLGGQQTQPNQPSNQENPSSSSSLNEGGASETSQAASADSPQNPSQSAGNKVNLNTAQKADLMKLTGIGDKKADQILAYRQQHGRFKTIDEIKQVSGIGDKTFLSLKDQLCV